MQRSLRALRALGLAFVFYAVILVAGRVPVGLYSSARISSLRRPGLVL